MEELQGLHKVFFPIHLTEISLLLLSPLGWYNTFFSLYIYFLHMLFLQHYIIPVFRILTYVALYRMFHGCLLDDFFETHFFASLFRTQRFFLAAMPFSLFFLLIVFAHTHPYFPHYLLERFHHIIIQLVARNQQSFVYIRLF